MSHNTLMIGMCVIDKDDNIIKQMPLNFMDPNARQVIARTAWWAMHHGHEMVTWPLETGEAVEKIDSREGK